jgi:class 3 adenylate cyclase
MAANRPQPCKGQQVATLLMTDIVDSTSTAAALGVERWADLLELHNKVASTGVDQHGGRVVDFAGDRLFAVFQAPEPAIACATALHALMRHLGLEVRAGVHVGEVAIRAEQVMGVAVHIAARIAAVASPGETLVSRTVKDLLAEAEADLCERGIYTLKGVPDQWKLFAVARTEQPARSGDACAAPSGQVLAQHRFEGTQHICVRPV